MQRASSVGDGSIRRQCKHCNADSARIHKSCCCCCCCFGPAHCQINRPILSSLQRLHLHNTSMRTQHIHHHTRTQHIYQHAHASSTYISMHTQAQLIHPTTYICCVNIKRAHRRAVLRDRRRPLYWALHSASAACPVCGTPARREGCTCTHTH